MGMTSSPTWSTFIALGDSLTEGMCDASRMPPGEYRGWADRLAMFLAGTMQHPDGMRYANLAIRSKAITDVVGRQLPRALAWKPDLVSLLAGGNDLVHPASDPIALAGQMDDAVAAIRATGADVLLVTMYRPQFHFLHALSRRAAIFNECLRETAQQRGAILLDLWGLREFADKNAWAPDRVHLSSQGHRALAYEAAHTLGLTDLASIVGLDKLFHDGEEVVDERAAAGVGTAEWATRHALPWLIRRAQGRHAGDGRVSKHEDGLIVLGGEGQAPAWI